MTIWDGLNIIELCGGPLYCISEIIAGIASYMYMLMCYAVTHRGIFN